MVYISMYVDHIIAGCVLVGLSLLLSHLMGIGKEREIFLSSLRVSVQLLLLGFLFKYIFDVSSLYGLMFILFIMTLIASLIATTRINIEYRFRISFISLFIATFLPLIILIYIGIIKISPFHVIPVGGLILGNALNSITIAVDRFLGETRNRILEIEGKVALGADLRTAMASAMRESLKTALIPKINMLQSAGIVHIPGITVGMLMAGADPFTSVVYQLTILYLILFIGIFSGYLMLNLSYRYILARAIML